MSTRTHVHEEVLPATPDTVFRLLVTPSAIRGWWSAARAIVVPGAGGAWAAAWGDAEDDPDYVTVATIAVDEPPHRLVLTEYRARARADQQPPGGIVTEFEVRPLPDGTALRVTQTGFPDGAEGDAFLQACDTGWRETFRGIRRYLDAQP